MSTHEALVVKIHTINEHPNADKLVIIPVFGYQCIVGKEDFKVGDLACFVEPDSLVNVDRSEFALLAEQAKPKYGGRARIKAIKLRKYPSQGFLVPVSHIAGVYEGMNLWDHFGLQHYDPEENIDIQKKMKQGRQSSPPPGDHPKYNIENLRKYPDVFEPGELVSVSEKVNGSNIRFTYEDWKFWVGSHNTWRKEKTTSFWDWWWAHLFEIHPKIRSFFVKYISKKFVTHKIESQRDDIFWDIYKKYPQVGHYLQDHPGYTLYGEIYGPIQKGFDYGSAERTSFVAFDVRRKNGGWLNYEDFSIAMDTYIIPRVPVIEEHMPFDYDQVLSLAEGPSLFSQANHIREGIVIRSSEEGIHPKVGRKTLKVVSQKYLEMK